MTAAEIIAWAERHGYARDAYGNWKRKLPTGTVVRIKLKKLSVRFEQSIVDRWVPHLTAYYTELAIGEGDRIVKRK